MRYVLHFFLLLLFTLPGCATRDKEIVTIAENNYVEVPKELLTHCSATAPPNTQTYAELDPQAKEYTLVMYASSLLKDIATCNGRIVKIEQWSQKQSIVFQDLYKKKEAQNARTTRDPTGE